MIDLNDDKFDAKEVSIFNNGEAGTVKATVKEITKKDDDSNKPDYAVYYEDDKGHTVNEGFYYVDTSREYAENALKKQGARLKHMVKAIAPQARLGKYETPKEMLDGVMDILKGNQGAKVKVAVSYGTTRKPSEFIGVKRTIPFILPANSEEEITFSNIDVTERPTPDEAPDQGDFGDSGSEKPNW